MSQRLSLHVARCIGIDLLSVQTSFAVAAALKKDRSSSVTPRTNGTKSCALAATVISCPPPRSKARHNNDCKEKGRLERKVVVTDVAGCKLIVREPVVGLDLRCVGDFDFDAGSKMLASRSSFAMLQMVPRIQPFGGGASR